MLQLTNPTIARTAQKATNLASRMVVINIQRFPFRISLAVLLTAAYSANSVLLFQARLIFIVRNAIRPFQSIQFLSSFPSSAVLLAPCRIGLSITRKTLRWTERSILFHRKLIKRFGLSALRTDAKDLSINSENSTLRVIKNEWTRFSSNVAMLSLCFLCNCCFHAASTLAVSVWDFIENMERKLSHGNRLA